MLDVAANDLGFIHDTGLDAVAQLCRDLQRFAFSPDRLAVRLCQPPVAGLRSPFINLLASSPAREQIGQWHRGSGRSR